MTTPQVSPQQFSIFENTSLLSNANLRSRENDLMANGLQNFALMSGIVVESARGSVITDIEGKQYFDIIGGIGVNGLGHSHPKWVDAMISQLQKISVGSFTSLPRVALLEHIKKKSLPGLSRLQLYSSGAEAVESALRLAKNFTQKWEFASFHGGFHGKTLGALGLMGTNFKDSYGPFAPGCHQLPFANCYRCPFKLEHPACGLACVEEGRKHLKKNVSKGLAAIIIEPIQGSAGNIIPPPDFLPAIKEVANEFDALFIADEMITGFGRTGRYWGSQLSGVKPDIMTIGKQFGGGFPVSGLLTNDVISKTVPWGNPSGSSSSYGGNPLACAAVKATLEIIEEEDLIENSRMLGKYFLSRLMPLEEEFPFIGQVRGCGMLLAIEFVEDKMSKAPLGTEKMKQLFQIFTDMGLLSMAYTSSFRIQPAMTIDGPTIDEITTILHKGLTRFQHLFVTEGSI